MPRKELRAESRQQWPVTESVLSPVQSLLREDRAGGSGGKEEMQMEGHGTLQLSPGARAAYLASCFSAASFTTN